MRVQIKPAHQIQRINSLMNQMENLNKVDAKTFMKRPGENANQRAGSAWSGAEIIEHMTIAHQAYEAKLNKALAQSKPMNDEVDVRSTRAIASFLIKRFPPQDGKIRFKMKTSKQFKPMLDVDQLTESDVRKIQSKFCETLIQLSEWVQETRTKDVLPHRFNSAIGAIVKFNASEACEFILCHNERHIHQLLRTLKA